MVIATVAASVQGCARAKNVISLKSKVAIERSLYHDWRDPRQLGDGGKVCDFRVLGTGLQSVLLASFKDGEGPCQAEAMFRTPVTFYRGEELGGEGKVLSFESGDYSLLACGMSQSGEFLAGLSNGSGTSVAIFDSESVIVQPSPIPSVSPSPSPIALGRNSAVAFDPRSGSEKYFIGAIEEASSLVSIQAIEPVTAAPSGSPITLPGQASQFELLNDGYGVTALWCGDAFFRTSSLVTGGDHSCALMSDQTLKCWGQGVSGQLGIGGSANKDSPQTIESLEDVIQVAAGGGHTCALESDGALYCWGNNSHGQLGVGGSSVSSPVPVSWSSPVPEIREVALGNAHSCALTSDDEVYCWGDHSTGQLGVGSAIAPATISSVPVRIIEKKISNGEFEVIPWVITSPSPVPSPSAFPGEFSWDPAAPLPSPFPSPIPSVYPLFFEKSVAVPVGASGRSGKIQCQFSGVVDDSTLKLQDISGESLGEFELTGLSLDQVFTWPAATSGTMKVILALERSSSEIQNLTCRFFAPLLAESISAGGAHTCVLTGDQEVKCWGKNDSGQLGNDSNSTSDFPVVVEELDDAEKISLGANHSCALKSDGSVACWGENEKGQLGDADTSDADEPVEVTGLDEIEKISLGSNHSCAIKSDDTLWCWGDHSSGQLGVGSLSLGATSRNYPVEVSGLSPFREVSAGGSHTCALVGGGSFGSDPRVYCWGANLSGQLGANFTSSIKLSPVQTVLEVDSGDGECSLHSAWSRNQNFEVQTTVSSAQWDESVQGFSAATDGEGNVVTVFLQKDSLYQGACSSAAPGCEYRVFASVRGPENSWSGPTPLDGALSIVQSTVYWDEDSFTPYAPGIAYLGKNDENQSVFMATYSRTDATSWISRVYSRLFVVAGGGWGADTDYQVVDESDGSGSILRGTHSMHLAGSGTGHAVLSLHHRDAGPLVDGGVRLYRYHPATGWSSNTDLASHCGLGGCATLKPQGHVFENGQGNVLFPVLTTDGSGKIELWNIEYR